MIKQSRLDALRSNLPAGWSVHTYSPGDGVTRYRFFFQAPECQSYFGPDSGTFVALGIKEAEAYVGGLCQRPAPLVWHCVTKNRVVIGVYGEASLYQAQEHCRKEENASGRPVYLRQVAGERPKIGVIL